jgi:hypothetical protein
MDGLGRSIHIFLDFGQNSPEYIKVVRVDMQSAAAVVTEQKEIGTRTVAKRRRIGRQRLLLLSI